MGCVGFLGLQMARENERGAFLSQNHASDKPWIMGCMGLLGFANKRMSVARSYPKNPKHPINPGSDKLPHVSVAALRRPSREI
jgi:hypothetical protein